MCAQCVLHLDGSLLIQFLTLSAIDTWGWVILGGGEVGEDEVGQTRKPGRREIQGRLLTQ